MIALFQSAKNRLRNSFLIMVLAFAIIVRQGVTKKYLRKVNYQVRVKFDPHNKYDSFRITYGKLPRVSFP